MEQLKENLTKVIRSMFDNSLQHIDKFYDFESFQDYYNDEFVRWRFNDDDSDLDIHDFASIYEFSYFDALKIIKEYYVDIEEHFEDYDDKQKIWNMVCFVCAINATVEITYDPKYKDMYHYDPIGDFKNECDEKIQELENSGDWDKCVPIGRMEKHTTIRFFKHLKEFDTSKAEEDLKVINLIYQKNMKQFQDKVIKGKVPEVFYIDHCDYVKKEYNKLFDFKCRGLAVALI
jgi:hypothetical protein